MKCLFYLSIWNLEIRPSLKLYHSFGILYHLVRELSWKFVTDSSILNMLLLVTDINSHIDADVSQQLMELF